MKWKLLLLSILIFVGLIYYSNPHKIFNLLMRTKPEFLFYMLLLCVVSAFIRTKRWMYLLRVCGIKIKFTQALKIDIAGLFISNITPAKTGEPIRSVFLKRISGVKIRASLPSIIIERLSDVIATTTIGIVGIALVLQKISSTIITLFACAVAVYASAVCALFFFLLTNKINWAAAQTKRIVSKLPKLSKHANKVERFIKDLARVTRLYSKKAILLAVLYSLAIWTLEGSIGYFAFAAIGVHVPIWIVVPALSILSLIVVLTLLPSGLGSGEFLSIVYYSSLVGLSAPTIMAAGIIVRLIGFWFYAVLGLIFINLMPKKAKTARKRARR